ncbi:hypothetical protein H9Q69_002180 [Fusarium xylarioides]|uniref:F-box domain-containing protein n=1 Tax=Fusarium xylarioides TaxID=221167 RepID=A0A9P7I0E5_9HYPO|nr:hypothetical protein H9Q70_003464 [Fusarium xylarioides]KAG5770954.1 hypothetical protein H9Q72_002328 [Fusarium xylarioides]KAG5798772.1 hypothetical protein H9Q69_002180 [Fusarium xylarioides]
MENPPLPTEILYQIFEHFCLHCQDKHSVSHEQIIFNKKDKNRRALISLSRTCKSWGCVAQNILHHYFKHSDDRNQILFCKTICEKPKLGEQLQVAILERNAGVDQKLFAQSWFKESMTRHAHLFGLNPLHLQSSVTPWGDYVAPIILLQALNLKYLVVHGAYNTSIFQAFGMETVRRNRAVTQKLESLSVGQQEIASLWYLELPVRKAINTLGGLLIILENLETLSISQPIFESLPEKLPLQKLRRLRIGNAWLSKNQLQKLINSTGKLEEFVYREIGDARPTVTSQEIFEMLLPMKDTLKRVVLSMYSSEQPPTAMAQLVNLQQLRVNAGVLCDISTMRRNIQDLAKDNLLDVFPPNLQTLCLDHSHTDAPRYRKALGSYISSTYRESPQEQKLREVTLHFVDKAFPNPAPWTRPVVPRPFRDMITCEGEYLRRECSSSWFENGCITATIAPFLWYSCDEVGENTMLPPILM